MKSDLRPPKTPDPLLPEQWRPADGGYQKRLVSAFLVTGRDDRNGNRGQLAGAGYQRRESEVTTLQSFAGLDCGNLDGDPAIAPVKPR